MKFFLYIAYFFRSARLRGLMNTIRLIRAELRYEKAFGLHTAMIKKSDSPDFFHYQGASYLVLLRIFGEMDEHTKEFELTDIGSGKGRVLFVAEHCGYSRLTGIELDEELVAQARQNAKRYLFKRPDSVIHFHQANALGYDYKNERAIYFLFNPFSEPILKNVLQKIKSASQQETWFIYMNPLFRRVFEEEGMELVKEIKTKRYLEAVVFRWKTEKG